MNSRSQFDQLFEKGRKAHDLGNIAEAEACYIESMKIAPGHPDVLHLMGVLYGQTGYLDDAEQLIRKALQSLPDDPIYLYNYGNVLVEMKRWNDAAKIYARATQQAPKNPDIAFSLALTLKKLSKLDAAEKFFRQVIRLNKNHAHALAELSGILEKKGTLEEAIALQERAIELEPNTANFYVNLGALKLKKGQWDAALILLDKALVLEKWHVPALAIKAVAHFEKGDDATALNLVDPHAQLSVTNLPLPPDIEQSSLIEAMVKHPSREWERVATTTKDGAQTGNLLSDPNPLINKFVLGLTSKIEKFIRAQTLNAQNPFLTQIPESWGYSIWATILEKGGHQTPHLHPSAWLSGVYYLEVPPEVMDNANTEHQGWIEFGAPGYGITPVRPPILRQVMPEPGKLIFFPSYFFHRTVPLSGNARRISIAFDVIPTTWRK